jgi:hypothetical protein
MLTHVDEIGLEGEYWVSCPRFTVWVEVRAGVVIDGAPVVLRFMGQSPRNLVRWFRRFGDTSIYILTGRKSDEPA